MTTGVSDQELAGAALRGSRRAFDILCSRYRREAELYARHYSRCPGLVEDLVSEALLLAFKNLHFWNIQEGSYRTWFFAILHNFAIDNARKRNAEKRRISGYLRTRKLWDPGDFVSGDPCEFHHERWFDPQVQKAVDQALLNLDVERRAWLIELPKRRQLDREKAALSRARHDIALPLGIELSGIPLREAVAKELMLTKLCGKHSGGAHL